ncbi:DEAD/DEAH box helicase [Treponema zuelzerae]|uniref:DEAD/DEAH box helicase n=1 Tax=Teretinema zuelzerae TaxID=156 RepID=A0AAE3JLC3_9SPIR|nr:DEAD/DEAH box helicase [Teretinema zuelzerae]MCD1654689.1 DEAD/DEAH box helicase [Teretinema zuelzerae]
MTTEDSLSRILSDPAFAPYIGNIQKIPAKDGILVPFPENLDPRLEESCRDRGMKQLYSHQRESWASVRGGSHTVIVTPTASGKTLCYNLPVMQTLLENPDARALYLFPTKALSQDQQNEINGMVGNVERGGGLEGSRIPLRVCIYDGDTPQSLRNDARDKGRIIISNPDMLHSGVLPNHTRWIRFFSNLKFIVIDEMHMYRGIFGSHMANLLRRLLRVARFYGSEPVFILCSATIGNPGELAEKLIGAPVNLIDKNGAPSGEKTVILYNPPLVDAVQGIRRSVMNESQRWALSFLKAGIKTILFAHSRVKTEVIASYINDSLANVFNQNHGITVVPYRGGLLPLERRKIEKGLREGDIQGVVSTNALELGIDIGGLDAAVVAGFPGSFSSFWQQAGRAGRRRGASVAVFIASASPLDQYIMNHPDYFFARPQETAWLDPDNPYVISDHIKCAAFELPFTDAELERGGFPETAATEILEYLQEDGILRHTGGRWHWSDRSYPAEAVSLRSATADNVVVVDMTKGRNAVIGEMDRPSARELLFPRAIYIHLGRQYVVTSLDIPNRRAEVEETEVNYYTDAVVKTDIKVLSEDERIEPAPQGSEVILGDLLVRTQVSKFKKIRFHTHENIGFGEIALDAEEHETRGMIILMPEAPDSPLYPPGYAELDEAARAEALSGIGSILRSVAPFFLLCDRRDIGFAPRVRDPHFGCPALYVFDSAPGGSGLSEALSLRLPEVFAAASERARTCGCDSGCPSCIGVLATGAEVKSAAVSLLAALSGS